MEEEKKREMTHSRKTRGSKPHPTRLFFTSKIEKYIIMNNNRQRLKILFIILSILGISFFNINTIFFLNISVWSILIANTIIVAIFSFFFITLNKLKLPEYTKSKGLLHQRMGKIFLWSAIIIMIVFTIFAIYIWPLTKKEILIRSSILLAIGWQSHSILKSLKTKDRFFIRNRRMKIIGFLTLYFCVLFVASFAAFKNQPVCLRGIVAVSGLAGAIMILIATIKSPSEGKNIGHP